MKSSFYALVILFFSLNASATTMQVNYNSSNMKMVSFTIDDVGYSEYATEFDIKLDGITLSGIDWNNFFTTAYCVDLKHSISARTYSNVTLELIDSSSSYLQAAWLMDKWGTEASGDAEREAGLQLAIWSTVYSDGFENSTYGDIGDFYKGYISSLPGEDLWGSLANHYAIAYTFDNSGNKQQDLLVQLNPVPEPGTLLLLGMGIAGLGAAGRKRFKSRKA